MSKALAAIALTLGAMLVIGTEIKDQSRPLGEEVSLRGLLFPFDGGAVLARISHPVFRGAILAS